MNQTKWYVTVIAIVSVLVALGGLTLVGIILSILSFVVAKISKSNTQIPLIALLICALVAMTYFFFKP